VEIFDPLSPGMLADPYPVYAALRRDDPVHWHDRLDSWVVTRYADCARALQDAETFASDFRLIGDDPPAAFVTLQAIDPPDHTIVRRLLVSALKTVDLAAWTEDVRTTVHKLLDSVDLTTFDFITEFAEPLTVSSLHSLFDVPFVTDDAGFREAQRTLMLSMDAGLAPERGAPGMAARAYLTALIEPWTARSARKSLASAVDVEAAGPLAEVLVNSVRAIFVAGYGSSSSMLGNAMRTLVEHGQLDGDTPPSITTAAFNELVRYVGPVQAESRVVTSAVTLGGCSLSRGSVVTLIVASANRDEAIFDEADELRLDREVNPHLGFGKGIHSCVGVHLAHHLGIEVLKIIAERFRVRLLEPPVQRRTATVRGVDRLMLQCKER
jgi:cytochrome P450